MDFKTRMKELIEKGVAGTKDLWDKTREKARDLSQQGVLMVEIGHLEGQAHHDVSLLGTVAYDILANQKKPAVHPEDPEVKAILEGIEAIKRRIEAKEIELSQVRNKGG